MTDYSEQVAETRTTGPVTTEDITKAFLPRTKLIFYKEFHWIIGLLSSTICTYKNWIVFFIFIE